MNTTALVTVARIVGAILIATGIGGAVVGGYAAVQEDAGWCNKPTIYVLDAQEADDILESNGSRGPTLSRIGYESLTAAEQRAIESALAGPDNVGEVKGAFPHAETFERGVIVRRGTEDYYAAVASYDECVAVPALTLPVGLTVVGLGIGAVLVPSFVGRGAGRGRSVSASALGPIRRPGGLSDLALFGAFFGGVLLALLHPAGVVVAGAAVGLTASSWERAVVLGAYVGGTVALVAGAFLWLDLGWAPPTLLGLPDPLALGGEAILATGASVLSRVLT